MFTMLSRSAVGKLKAIFVVDLIIVAAAAGAYLYLLDQGVITGAAKPAELVMSGLVVSPQAAFVGDTIQITLNITNNGEVAGNDTFNLLINEQIKDTTNITLANGESQKLDFSDIEKQPGKYTEKMFLWNDWTHI